MCLQQVLGHMLVVARQILTELGADETTGGYRVVMNDELGRDQDAAAYHPQVHVLAGRKMGWPPG